MVIMTKYYIEFFYNKQNLRKSLKEGEQKIN